MCCKLLINVEDLEVVAIELGCLCVLDRAE